jgi:hypothetical protein
MAGAVKSAYVDTNLVSGIRRRDRGTEQAPLNRLFDAHDEGRIALVTSPVTRRELSALPPERYAADEKTYRRLGELAQIEEQPLTHLQPITARSGAKGPLPIRVPDFAFLDDLLTDRADAEHIFQAHANGIDYFVTTDDKTILSQRAAIEAKLPIRLRRPSEVVAEVSLGTRPTVRQLFRGVRARVARRWGVFRSN